jgi:hypothetical protein
MREFFAYSRQDVVRRLMHSIRVLALAAAFSMGGSAARAECKDCDPVTGLTVRETIVKQRADEARRRIEDSSVRPWDGTRGRDDTTGAPAPKLDRPDTK